MKIWVPMLAALLTVGFFGGSTAEAAKADKKAGKGGTSGTIEKIEGKAPTLSITVSGGKKGASTTFTTDEKTAVTADGQAKNLKDLKVGEKVSIDGSGGTAKSIAIGAGKDKAADKGKAAKPKADAKKPKK